MTIRSTSYLLSLLIISLSLFSSCKKDEGVTGNYSSSLKAFKTFKTSVNNSYQYSVISSSWTGYSSETMLTIKNGQVVERAFVSKTVDGKTGAVTVVKQWNEVGTTLNSHPEGAASLTLDEVYTKAKNEWLIASKNTETYFETKNQGMISTAGYREKTCADDCFRGIEISFIRKITGNL